MLGPGAYDLPNADSDVRLVTFPKEARNVQFIGRDVPDMPGPGRYDRSEAKGVQVAFTKGSRDLHSDVSHLKGLPGPGEYTTRRDLDFEWSEAIGERAPGGLWDKQDRGLLRLHRSSLPGPAQYTIWGAMKATKPVAPRSIPSPCRSRHLVEPFFLSIPSLFAAHALASDTRGDRNRCYTSAIFD